MNLFKRKPPAREEKVEAPRLVPHPHLDGDAGSSPPRDIFPIPDVGHLPPHLAQPHESRHSKNPLPLPPKPVARQPKAMPAPKPEALFPEEDFPREDFSEDNFSKEQFNEGKIASDDPEEVVEKGGDALSELEELLKPGSGQVRTARGLVKIADITEPEILKAFVELVGNPITVSVVDGLVGKELALEEIAAQTKNPPEKVKQILQQLVCLGLVEDFWYKTPSGKHINKFKFLNTTGTLDFDLKDLGKALTVKKLEEKSAGLVDLVSREGKVPKSLVVKELGLTGEEYLDQIIRFTERFKLPNVRSLVMQDAREIEEEAPPLATEIRPLPKRDEKKPLSGFETEFEELDKYMKKLETVKK